MTTVITSAYMAATSISPWHTRILYDQIARRDAAVVSVSGTAAGAFPEAPVNDQTYEWWEGDALPANWEVDAGAAVTCDAVGIAAHDAGTQGNTIQVQTSSDGVAWTDVTDAVDTPSDDAPIMILFEEVSARHWRLNITGGSAPPKMCVIYIGKALPLLRPVKWNGHTPGVLNPMITKRPSKSERGQRLGTTLIREGYEANFTLENLPELWVREKFLTFTRAAWRYGYFVSWRPIDFPDEPLFGWTQDPIVPSNSGSGRLPRDGATETDGRRMSVSWSMVAHGGHESGIVPWGAT